MYLAESVFGYSIFYDTRHSKTADFTGTSLPNLTAKPSAETEATLKSDESVKVIHLEQVGFMNSFVNCSSLINDVEIEVFKNINAQTAMLKR